MTGARQRRPRLAAALGLIPLLVAALVVSACTSTIAGTAHQVGPVWIKAPNVHLTVNGTDHGPYDQLAENAISDIQKYWTAQMPKIFGKQYRPVTGGFYSIDPQTATSLPCGATRADIGGNAFYCPGGDLVAWDRTNLLPRLSARYGDYTIALVFAHEWGHAIQARSGVSHTEPTIVRETQADCYAGAFTKWAYDGHAPHFKPSGKQLDESLAGFLTFADPVGTSQSQQGAHGNAFDRVTALQEGYDKGPAYCASNANFNANRKFTEIPFTSNTDVNNKGNLPLEGTDGAITVGSDDLATYWKAEFDTGAFGKKYHKTWTPLSKPDVYSGTKGPSCDGSTTDKTIVYCPDDKKLVVQGTPGMQSVYNASGDYGPMVMIATGYAMAARHDIGKSTGDENGLLGSVCLAGVYTAHLFQNTEADTPKSLKLSPGDLDEAIEALLLGMNDQAFDGSQGTTGFERVNVFSQGVWNGFGACNSY